MGTHIIKIGPHFSDSVVRSAAKVCPDICCKGIGYNYWILKSLCPWSLSVWIALNAESGRLGGSTNGDLHLWCVKVIVIRQYHSCLLTWVGDTLKLQPYFKSEHATL